MLNQEKIISFSLYNHLKRQVILITWSSLTLCLCVSCHPSIWSINPGRSSRLYPLLEWTRERLQRWTRWQERWCWYTRLTREKKRISTMNQRIRKVMTIQMVYKRKNRTSTMNQRTRKVMTIRKVNERKNRTSAMNQRTRKVMTMHKVYERKNRTSTMNQRTGKVMLMHKALHTRDNIDRLYVRSKEGGREPREHWR